MLATQLIISAHLHPYIWSLCQLSWRHFYFFLIRDVHHRTCCMLSLWGLTSRTSFLSSLLLKKLAWKQSGVGVIDKQWRQQQLTVLPLFWSPALQRNSPSMQLKGDGSAWYFVIVFQGGRQCLEKEGMGPLRGRNNSMSVSSLSSQRTKTCA